MEHGLRPIAVGIVGTKSRARTQLGKKVVLNSDRDQIRVRLQPRQNQCQTISKTKLVSGHNRDKTYAKPKLTPKQTVQEIKLKFKEL
jgi:ribosomal protein S8